MVISAEKVQEIVEEKEAEYKKLEEEYWFLKEEYGDLKAECEDLEDKCESYKKASQTVLSIYNEDLKKMEDLQKLNNKLVKSNKAANRDFFILAAAYVATLMLMIYLFIRQGSDIDVSITGIRKRVFYIRHRYADCWRSYRDVCDCYRSFRYRVSGCEWY